MRRRESNQLDTDAVRLEIRRPTKYVKSGGSAQIQDLQPAKAVKDCLRTTMELGAILLYLFVLNG